jgi:hypothetical protein
LPLIFQKDTFLPPQLFTPTSFDNTSTDIFILDGSTLQIASTFDFHFGFHFAHFRAWKVPQKFHDFYGNWSKEAKGGQKRKAMAFGRFCYQP